MMKRVILALMILGLAGCVRQGQEVSPYLNGVNVMYTDEWLRGQSPSGTVPSAATIFKIVRFPGGLLADKYHWITGETKDFVQFCENIGAEKMITVNFKTGRVEEAANWVEFCNGSAPAVIPDEWKKIPFAYNHKAPVGYFAYLRESTGRKQPYGVKFWEIGNEIDWWNRIDAADYAQEALDYARALRAKDKNILIGACGSPLDDRWNEAVLRTAGRDIDFLIIHIYGGPERLYEDKNEEYRVLFSKLGVVEERIKKIKGLIEKYAPHCKIAVTEGNTSYNEFGLGGDELKKWKSALWIAGLRNILIRQGVMAYCHWNLCDGGAYGVVNMDGSVTPVYEVLKLYTRINTDYTRMDTDCARTDTDKLDYVVAEDKIGKKAYIVVVNRDWDNDIEETIDVRGIKSGRTAQIKVLFCGDENGMESFKTKTVEDKCRVENGKIKYKFKRASVTVIET